jgi:ABC-type glycerol-3-phosphate transport system permease component
MPAFTVAVIFTFNFVWSDFLTPFIYLKSKLVPFSVILQTGLQPPWSPDGMEDIPVRMAASVYFVLPLIIFFFLTQKYIIKGIVTSGLKG